MFLAGEKKNRGRGSGPRRESLAFAFALEVFETCCPKRPPFMPCLVFRSSFEALVLFFGSQARSDPGKEGGGGRKNDEEQSESAHTGLVGWGFFFFPC